MIEDINMLKVSKYDIKRSNPSKKELRVIARERDIKIMKIFQKAD